MTIDRIDTVHELIKAPKETEWVEFKHNNTDPLKIGECLSALANAATLCGRSKAYMLWGIDDQTHRIVGTTFHPGTAKVGDEELENLLLRLLSPRILFRFLS